MSGEKRPHLRVVGGNDALVRMPRSSREARWPPLRVIEPDTCEAAPVPLPAPEVVRPSIVTSAPKRAAWSQALLAGLMVVMLSSVGQAIAAHW